MYGSVRVQLLLPVETFWSSLLVYSRIDMRFKGDYKTRKKVKKITTTQVPLTPFSFVQTQGEFICKSNSCATLYIYLDLILGTSAFPIVFCETFAMIGMTPYEKSWNRLKLSKIAVHGSMVLSFIAEIQEILQIKSKFFHATLCHLSQATISCFNLSKYSAQVWSSNKKSHLNISLLCGFCWFIVMTC